MNGIHPKANAAAICALGTAILATGCRSTSSGVNNPFLAPDRVAPPSTRALAPGQAQPYYQGDPLPVMQSAATPVSNSLLTGDTAAARTATGKTLAWNASPAGSQPAGAATQASSTSLWPPITQPAAPLAYAPEPAVSVPVDTGSLRFPIQPTPTSQVASGSSPQVPAPQISAGTPNQGVMLASYNTPSGNVAPVTQVTPSTPSTASSAATSAWRAPQFNGVTPSSGYTQQAAANAPTSPQSLVSPTPITLPTNPMAVDLRAVPSPAQPGDPMPRVRVPGYDDTPEMASADGFRPRASMR